MPVCDDGINIPHKLFPVFLLILDASLLVGQPPLAFDVAIVQLVCPCAELA
jgi:hypothetical protein